jgi:hypothetical protein
MEFLDLGFVVPEKCRSYTVRLKQGLDRDIRQGAGVD